MVEGARLESVYTGNGIAGSNPAPSAFGQGRVIFALNLRAKKGPLFRKTGNSSPLRKGVLPSLSATTVNNRTVLKRSCCALDHERLEHKFHFNILGCKAAIT